MGAWKCAEIVTSYRFGERFTEQPGAPKLFHDRLKGNSDHSDCAFAYSRFDHLLTLFRFEGTSGVEQTAAGCET